MKKILFAYDFSESSLNAFRYAVHFANTIGATITTLHVYNKALMSSPDYYKSLTENYDLSDWGTLEGFNALVPKLKQILLTSKVENLKILHELDQGDPAAAIVNASEREKADYIVMGTIGSSGLAEIFLGSVSEKVLNDAPCDVIVVPHDYRYALPSKMLYLTDFEQYGFRKLEKVLALASLFEAHVDVLQVKTRVSMSDRDILRKWELRFQKRDVSFHLHAGQNSEEAVSNFADAAGASLVIIAKHRKKLLRRIFLYSLSQQLAFHSKIPVLGLHAKA